MGEQGAGQGIVEVVAAERSEPLPHAGGIYFLLTFHFVSV
jgi:hypothetical protein